MNLDEQRFCTVFERAATAIGLLSTSGQWLEVNQKLCDLLGYSREELLEHTLQKLTHPDDEADDECVAHLLTGELQTHSQEKRYSRKDSATVWVELTLSLVRGPLGEPKYSIAVLADITKRKRAEEALDSLTVQQSAYQQVQRLNVDLERQVRERTAQLQQALDFEATLKRITDQVRDSLEESQIMRTVVQEVGQCLGVKRCNTAWYDEEQTIANICYEYTTSVQFQGEVMKMADYPDFFHQLLLGQHFQFCSIGYPFWRQETVLACPISDDRGVLGDLWLYHHHSYAFNEVEIRLVQQVANQCAIAIRQARLYQAAAAQVEELQKLNQLKDDFLSTISHELRTPISNMRVAIKLLQIAPTAAERQEQYLQILQAECDREAELIDNLLDLQLLDAASYSLSFEPIDLSNWLPGIVKPFELRTQQRQQQLRVALTDCLLPLRSDRASLGRVLAELLNNAHKYTSAGGEITFSICQAEIKPAIGVVPIAGHGPLRMMTTFTVSNQASIPASELPRIFDKLYRIPQADPWKQGGTGLGLALVQKLVKQLQGTIEVESSGGWTTFSVQFPNAICN